MRIADHAGRAHEVAQQHDVQAMRLVHKFDWLTTDDLAHATGMHIDVARRVFKRLEKREYVFGDHLPKTKTRYYRLTARGATALNAAENVASYRSGERIELDATYQHRHLANRYFIAKISEHRREDIELVYFTEHDIASKRAPFQSAAKKTPDGLIMYLQESDYWSIDWIEAELSWKKHSDYKALLRFIILRLTPDESDRVLATETKQKSRRNLCLGQVVVVCTEKKDAEDEDHVGRIQRALTKIMPYLYQSQAHRLLDDLIIAIEKSPYDFDHQSARDLLGENILNMCKKDSEPHDSMSIEKAVAAGAAPKPKKDWLESFLQGLGYTK